MNRRDFLQMAVVLGSSAALLYRVRYGASIWRKGTAPKLEGNVVEGDPKFSR